jgi:hypothetical protein
MSLDEKSRRKAAFLYFVDHLSAGLLFQTGNIVGRP